MPQSDSATLDLFENYQDYLALQHLYQAALKQLQMKFEVLNDEFQIRSGRSPIHHIETRLKSTASILAKLQKRGCEVTLDSAKQNINDLAGVRVVCGYIDDVYAVAEMLLRQSDVRLVKRQDYIQAPNFNGYRSLHLVIETPVYLSEKKELVHVEVQIRTIAMNFWATLEHDLKYKTDSVVSAELAQQLKDCAETIASTDPQMQDIYKALHNID